MNPELFGSKLFQSVRHWWHAPNADEQYLAAANDLADLERRMREIERRCDGLFITFNH